MVLNSSTYEYTQQGLYLLYIRTAMASAQALARDISILEDDENLASILQRPFFRGCQWAAVLQLKVKSHKAPGAVVGRPLHTTVNAALEGFSKWVIPQLRAKLDALPYLVRDAAHAKQLILRTRIDTDHTLLKIDSKDFFLSGRSTELVAAVMLPFPQSERSRILQAVLGLLLESQFVKPRSPTLLSFEGAWRVLLGSGMGLAHSGFVADLAYASLAEAWLIPSILQTWRIPCTLR